MYILLNNNYLCDTKKLKILGQQWIGRKLKKITI